MVMVLQERVQEAQRIAAQEMKEEEKKKGKKLGARDLGDEEETIMKSFRGKKHPRKSKKN